MNLFLTILLAVTIGQVKLQDKVVAQVDGEVILKSDIDEALEFLKSQYPIAANDEQTVRKQILDELIKQKLLVYAAKQDTSIKVTDEEVNRALDEQIKNLEQSMGTENFEAELKREGLTRETLKEKLRDKVKDQLYIQKYIDRKINPRIVVTPDEVKRFYEEKKDSLPEQPPSVNLASILIRIKPSKEQIEKARKKAELIYQRLIKGEDFEELAQQYSDDPNTRDLGGDLGYIRLSDVQGPVREVISKLEPGEISKPYYDENGFHIFRVDEKNNDIVRLRHILIRPEPTKKDSLKKRKFAMVILQKLKSGASFADMASRYSDDPNTRQNGGVMGYIPESELPPEIKKVVDTLKVGQISGLIETPAGFYILKLLDRKKGGRPTFEEVKNELELLLKQRKLQKEVDKLVERLRKKVYVEIKSEP